MLLCIITFSREIRIIARTFTLDLILSKSLLTFSRKLRLTVSRLSCNVLCFVGQQQYSTLALKTGFSQLIMLAHHYHPHSSTVRNKSHQEKGHYMTIF